MILCEEHKELLKYFCFECNKYYCTFCIKGNNNLNHNDSHSCFSTLNISKSEFNELNSLISNFYKLTELLDEQKVDRFVKTIIEKKEKDLSIIDKLKECIKYRYDTIIALYENLKKNLSSLKNDLINEYSVFYKNYNEGKFEPNNLSTSIFQTNNKMNILDSNISCFFNPNENNFIFKIRNFKNILNNQIKKIRSPMYSMFFNDFYLMAYPYGFDEKSSYLELGIIFESKLKKNYNIKAIITIININGNKEYERKVEIDSYNKQLYIDKFYITKNLEKYEFIDNNGDLEINCRIELDKDNSFLYDIQEYYEKFINKNNNQSDSEDKIDQIFNIINEKEKKLLGKKHKKIRIYEDKVEEIEEKDEEEEGEEKEEIEEEEDEEEGEEEENEEEEEDEEEDMEKK